MPKITPFPQVEENEPSAEPVENKGLERFEEKTACVLILHEKRKLVYAHQLSISRKALETLEYKGRGCIPTLHEVVNWYMERTIPRLEGLARKTRQGS